MLLCKIKNNISSIKNNTEPMQKTLALCRLSAGLAGDFNTHELIKKCVN